MGIGCWDPRSQKRDQGHPSMVADAVNGVIAPLTRPPSQLLLMNKRRVWCRTSGARRLPMDPALPGWADFWCRPSGPGLQTPLSHVHSSLNLPQASQLLGTAKERVGFPLGIGCRDPRSQTRDQGHPSISSFDRVPPFESHSSTEFHPPTEFHPSTEFHSSTEFHVRRF